MDLISVLLAPSSSRLSLFYARHRLTLAALAGLSLLLTTPESAQTFEIRAGTIYTSPDQSPIRNGAITIVDGRIARVGVASSASAKSRAFDCPSCTITPGFWNAHVHFTERKWDDAKSQPTVALQTALDDMLLSRGFTTVVDVGSDPRNTPLLRRRIEAGELKGPRIYTAGIPIYPPRPGIPFYLRDLPVEMRAMLPQPATPEEATRAVEQDASMGADLTKLFTGSYVARDVIKPMPLDIARAAVDATHARGRLVFAHPSNFAGAKIALESGVDVLAHAPDDTAGVDRAFLKSLVDHHMAMVPTLKMFSTTVTPKDAYMMPIIGEVRIFHEFGGQLIFGTDVGYMQDYSTDEEFRRLAIAGLTSSDILRMLTLAPAERFGVSEHTGTLAVGKDGDLTVLEADPSKDSTNFARVRCTVRHGQVIWGNCGRKSVAGAKRESLQE